MYAVSIEPKSPRRAVPLSTFPIISVGVELASRDHSLEVDARSSTSPRGVARDGALGSSFRPLPAVRKLHRRHWVCRPARTLMERGERRAKSRSSRASSDVRRAGSTRGRVLSNDRLSLPHSIVTGRCLRPNGPYVTRTVQRLGAPGPTGPRTPLRGCYNLKPSYPSKSNNTLSRIDRLTNRASTHQVPSAGSFSTQRQSAK